MSLDAVRWAKHQTTGSAPRKAVLLALADRHHAETGACFPSVETIAKDTELSERTVRRALDDLAEAGFVTRERRRRGDGSLSTYAYEFPDEAYEPPVDRVSEPPDSLTATPSGQSGRADLGSKPLTRTTAVAVVPDSREDDVDRSPSDVGRVYSTWRMERGKTRKAYDRISPNRRTKIEARLREFTADELCEAIRGVARDPWKDRPLHDDLVVIFRNREQVEKFLELAAGTTANGRGTSADAVRIVEETLARTRGAR